MITRSLRTAEACAALLIISIPLACASLGAGSRGAPPKKMIGTWFFDNVSGDNEQMAVFPNGRVVVLYSNGHKDETLYVGGALARLAEYDAAEVETSLADDGALVQRFANSSVLKTWKRISETPCATLMRPLN